MTSALFFDVDGTLIDSYHGMRSISDAVSAELGRLQAAGHRLFLSSGRPKVLITPELASVGFDGMVLINGGYVEIDGEPIYEERMGAELAAETLAFLRESGYEYMLVCARRNYMHPDNSEFIEFFSRDAHSFEYGFDDESLLDEVIKFEAMVPIDEREAVVDLMRARFGDVISCDGHGGAGTFELFPTAISKAKGIEAVLGHLGIDRAHSFGFGDGTNDIEMLAACGTGVAMGNAEEVVKEAADLVCGAVWEDGLADALRMLFR